MDVRKIDVGSFAVDRYHYKQDGGDKSALLEGMRMSEAVAPSVAVDPSLVVGRGSSVLIDPKDAVATGALSNSAEPVLRNRGMVVGYAVSGADKPDPPGKDVPGPDATALTIRVLRFPDESVAKVAAREVNEADFDVASGQNRRLSITQYPDAYIHYRPGVPNVGFFMGYKQFVVVGFIARPTAVENDLTDWVRKALDAETATLSKFQPTPIEKIKQLRQDPDNLLARLVVDKRRDRDPDLTRFAVYGPSWLTFVAPDQAARRKLESDTGVDAIGLVDNGTIIRVRDEQAGQQLISALAAQLTSYQPSATPQNAPGTKCLTLSSNVNDWKTRCYVAYKRYVVLINSDDDGEVRTKVPAEYALLANSL
ncbi:DUF7373 family lipoprotein [Nocardia arthritidis]|uniref:Uncharacterized protein n=1 Tax=Nocardia arthritidis TaxID=228602 RepID=A0A6G9YJL9_9NOCA|nr:hypothetical protein [Nocardia arthritidis]QIS13402.1 hypothetical protein F5544_27745 [Nocardia arthritidis]